MNTDSSDSKNFQRRSGRDSNVDEEVQRLLKRNTGKLNPQEFQRLRGKYDDPEMLEKVQKAFVEKYAHISKKAKKFAQLIRERYSTTQYPFHVLLEKAHKYKVKHGLSDDEFAEFQRIYEQELVGLKSPEILSVNTNMMKVLGNIMIDAQGFNTKLNDNDYKYLQEIFKLHSTSRALHSQVVLQSLQYQDVALEARNGTYNRDFGQRPGDHIHPVIVALFLPKINVLDSHFLLSNITNIVKTRYNGETLQSLPDYELFYALTSDPNDVVCDSRSPVLDLLNRAQLQVQLWNSVLNLRNGQYFNTSFREFVTSVDMCKLNKQDSPDLIYGRYDGTVIKRLFSAFSFRPTVVATTSVYQMVATNPYQQNIRPVVTSVPMINLRLPPSITDNSPVRLKDALDQQQLILENNMFNPKQTSLIYSRGVLVFYVDRRANVIRVTPELQPFNIARLPSAVAGFESLNTRPVIYEDDFTIRSDKYYLRSVVVAEVHNETGSNKNIVIGSSALVRRYSDFALGAGAAEDCKYDPYHVQHGQSPISLIGSTSGQVAGQADFRSLAQETGVIFIYENKSDAKKDVLY